MSSLSRKKREKVKPEMNVTPLVDVVLRAGYSANADLVIREKTGIPARLVVVGMASNGFTIADPADGGMLDVVGFDTATPRLIAEFVR